MPTTNTGLVLVHGSELGAWLWDRLVPHLERPALAVDLPGRGAHPADRRTVRLGDAVEAVVADVEASELDRVVLVAHSFSGVLMPAVAERLGDRVAAIVLVAASVPQAGRSWAGLLPLPQRLVLRAIYTLRPAGVLSPEGENRRTLCNDLDEPTTAWFLAQRVPEAPRLLLDPVSTATFPDGVPLHYLRLGQDQSIGEEARERMIARLPGVPVHDLDTGHLPMLSQPETLAGLLDDIAAQAVPAS